tara:strand:- start:728 stop:1837 length:1110 start_codon:yes stop_codon:yes gene_type:complete
MIDEIKLTKNLIKINSTNPGIYEKEAFDFVETLLKKKKINYKKYLLHKSRPNLVIKIGNKNIKDNILFVGHLDTVPFGQLKWKYNPLGAKELNGKIYGRGSTDMKSGIASMCAAILNHKNFNFKNKNIILALVSGEETGCEGSKLLAEKLKKEKISVIISGEPTDNYPVLGHKGVLWLEASVSGKTSHGSSPQYGINSIYNAIDHIKILKNYNFKFKNYYMKKSTINIGTFFSGQNINSVPDKAKFSIDIRTVDSNHLYLKEIKKIFKYKNVKLKEIVNLDMVYNEKWKKLKHLNLLKNICKFNKKIFTPKFASYFTDISPFQKDHNKPFNIIVGPGSIQMAHQTDEYVKKSEIIKSRKIYEYLINEFC